MILPLLYTLTNFTLTVTFFYPLIFITQEDTIASFCVLLSQPDKFSINYLVSPILLFLCFIEAGRGKGSSKTEERSC